MTAGSHPVNVALAAAQKTKEKDYWVNQLSGVFTGSYFPYDFSPKPDLEPKRETLYFTFSPGELIGMMKLRNNSDNRLHMILAAGLAALLNRYTGNRDIVLGTPISRQEQQDENPLINTMLPIRARFYHPHLTFKELLLQVGKTIIQAVENQNYPLEVLMNQGLWAAVILLENIHDPQYLGRIKPDLVFSFQRSGDSLAGSIHYNAYLYRADTIERLSGHFRCIIHKVTADVNRKLSSIDILTPEEKQQLVMDFNNSAVPYSQDKTLPELFEQQVKKTPDDVVLVGMNESRKYGMPESNKEMQITYRELNEKSGGLAQLLIEKGVCCDTIVGIMAERSIETIISIMAILAARGAYLPIDPDYPVDRINYMLKDSSAMILVSQVSEVSGWNGPVIPLLRGVPEGRGVSEPSISTLTSTSTCQVSPTNLAYIIYTSGTTGKPKGVMVEHRNAVNVVSWFGRQYVRRGSYVLQMSDYTFDPSVNQVFGTLLHGGTLHVISREVLIHPVRLRQYIDTRQIQVINFVPTLLKELLSGGERLRSIQKVLSGSEKLEESLKDVLLEKGYELYNQYGPTETTIDALVDRCSPGKVTLGKPIDNVMCYILGSFGNLVPIGVTGEFYISGSGVSRGYLNNPELTAEKFQIHNDRWHYKSHRSYKSYITYKTGDLARWLPDGRVEFLGRMDHQVKIRGHRVELKEIERHLLNYPGIREALVTVVTGSSGETGIRYLGAYIAAGVDRSTGIIHQGFDFQAIKEHLLKQLPEYMVPVAFKELDRLPRRLDGQIDRPALPTLNEKENTAAGPGYQGPRNAVEEELVKTWQKVLGKKTIGIHDNFFMMGGDSIKTIQIASRMAQAGYKVEMADIFRDPTIAQLALKVKKINRIAEQDTVTGVIPLNPIQREFFAENKIDPHHYNHSVLLYSKEGFDPEAVRAVFTKIQAHHDALRMTYTPGENGTIIQENQGLEYPLWLEVFDCRNLENPGEAMMVKANEIQAGIDLENGPLMRLGLFYLDSGHRLLIVIHHLVIDGISWRILLEDITTLYQQYLNSEPLQLPLKTDPFKLWSGELSAYANSDEFLRKTGYWKQLEAEAVDVPAIPLDFPGGSSRLKDAHTLSVSLSEEKTGLLLTKVNNAFGTEINDILLSALVLAIKKTFGNEKVFITLEGHGREQIAALEGIDVARTVGWFTAKYPVLLDISLEQIHQNLSRQLKEVKERLRRVPDKGIGYGILKYLTAEEHKRDMEFKVNPRVSFNYLGQFDEDFQETSFGFAREPMGEMRSLSQHRGCHLEISGMIANKRLTVSLVYSRQQFKEETAARLLDHYKKQLDDVISYCSSGRKPELTPSDLGYRELSIDELEGLTSSLAGIGEIKDIYPLSPMQEGLMYHTLLDRSFSVYFTQIVYRLHGDLNIPLVEKSFNELLKRYDILRTVFIIKGFDRPLQMVFKERRVVFLYKDLRKIILQPGGTVGDEKQAYIDRFKEKDRKRSFDLSADVMMRGAVLQLDENEYEFTWSMHHILMDGWCMGILISEFLHIYNCLLQGKPYGLPEVKQYREYIHWIEKRDKEKTKVFWREYLKGFQRLTGIQQRKRTGPTGQGYKNREFVFTLDKERTAALNRLTGIYQVTLNTVMQVIWAILLSRYNFTQDVVFGVVVSGRPSEITGIETMVGLFINTIPVRVTHDHETSFPGLLTRIQKEAIECEAHHYCPLAEIPGDNRLAHELIDHVIGFENYPVFDQIEQAVEQEEVSPNTGNIPLRVSNLESFEQGHYDLNLLIVPGEHLSVKFVYNGNCYERNSVEKAALHVKEIIRVILEDNAVKLKNISISHNLLAAESKVIDSDHGDFRL